MPNYKIRPLTMADAPQAAALWHTVFGDDEALVLEFFRLFGNTPHFGACAEADGKIAAAAYCPEGTDYIASDGTIQRGAYLYAVATHPDHRKQGLAKEVCLFLRDAAFAQGASYVFTRPSEESLYPWYEEKIDAVPCLSGCSARFTRDGNGTLPVAELSFAEYARLREQLQTKLPHVRHSLAWLEWESLLHRFYGGGFYRIGEHIATLYRDGSTLQIGELLPRPDADAVQSLLKAANAETCVCTFHGEGQYVSAVSADGTLPTDAWFGPCYG